jgi:small subunit ribosomal protein S3Ae
MNAEKSEKRQAVKKSWREKAWHDVVSPPMFGGRKIGETLTTDAHQLTGRVFETTLGDLIDDFSKSHIKLYFQVKGIDGNRALTSFIGHDMARDYVRSQIRRRATRIGDISTVTTQDGCRLRVSSIVTTWRRVQSSRIEAIHRDMQKVIKDRAAERTFDQFVQEVVLGKLASDIYKAAKRYCPVTRVEVWKTKVLAGPA